MLVERKAIGGELEKENRKDGDLLGESVAEH